MTKARTPAKVAENLHELAALLPKILTEYATVYDFAFSVGGGPSGESGRGGVISESKPTEDAAMSGAKGLARARARRAGRSIERALKEVLDAQADLRGAFGKDVTTEGDLSRYRQVTRMMDIKDPNKDSVDEARAMQRKREAAGDV